MTPSPAPFDPARSVVLTFVADPAQLPLARVVAASCGAQAGLPMDRVEDLRQCTQEALAVLLAHGCTGEVEVRFWPEAGCIGVRASGSGADAALPEPTSFAWLLLDELADRAEADLRSDRLSVHFLIRDRSGSVAASRDQP